MASTKPARGMRDFLPADVRKRNYVINIIKEVYESYGFEPLETPAIENLETLTGKYGEEGGQLMFKILKRGEKLGGGLELVGEPNFFAMFKAAQFEAEVTGNSLESIIEREGLSPLVDLALRYDLTVPLARVVANNRNELPKFFKRYQIQPVWRADRPARGRFREFYQCDVDAIGSQSMAVEAELIAAVSEILLRPRQNDTNANFDDFVVLINHRDVLFGLLDYFEIPTAKHTAVLVAIDKADKIGWSGVHDELIKLNAISVAGAKEFVQTLFSSVGRLSDSPDLRSEAEKLSDQNDEYFENFQNLIGGTEYGNRGLSELQQFFELSKGLPSSGHVRFQPSLARGLSYYTGAIFEIGLNRLDFAGSIGGGGRYDGLIGMFGKEQIPACGFSLGLERILVVMEERGMFPPEIAESRAADVLVTIWNEETVAESLKLARELREKGVRVTVYPEADKLGKQFKYADSIGIPFVCVQGDEELAAGKVKLKNMNTGDESVVNVAEAAGIIK